MPRYHFDVRDGEAFVKDEEGSELPDIAMAQITAAHVLADMVNDLPLRAAEPSGYHISIDVRDEAGPLFLLSFAFWRKN